MPFTFLLVFPFNHMVPSSVFFRSNSIGRHLFQSRGSSHKDSIGAIGRTAPTLKSSSAAPLKIHLRFVARKIPVRGQQKLWKTPPYVVYFLHVLNNFQKKQEIFKNHKIVNNLASTYVWNSFIIQFLLFRPIPPHPMLF